MTARSEEPEIVERCRIKGISFLSKTLIPYIPICKEAHRIVLIDDDKLIHWRWSEFCKINGLILYSYFSVDEFVRVQEEMKKGDIIFLDSDLGNGLKGEIVGEQIFQLGFANLYLSTNYPKDAITKPLWIKSVLTKNPEEAFAEVVK